MSQEVMWITQLVVHQEHCGKGHASTLLRFLITSCNPEIVGVASSHPHAILALKKASTSLFDENFVRTHLRRILDICNVPYLKLEVSYKRVGDPTPQIAHEIRRIIQQRYASRNREGSMTRSPTP